MFTGNVARETCFRIHGITRRSISAQYTCVTLKVQVWRISEISKKLRVVGQDLSIPFANLLNRTDVRSRDHIPAGDEMPDRSAHIRHWLLIRSLCAARSGRSLQELAEQFSVSQKSIRRDLDALLCAGFRLTESTEERGRKKWRLERPRDMPLPELELTEAASLYLGRRFMEPLAGTALWEAAQSAFIKLQQQFCPEAIRYLETLAQTIHETPFGRSDYTERATVIDSLMSAVNECRATRLLYLPKRLDQPDEYEVAPFGLVFHRHTLYLIAGSADRQGPRHFKIDRIREVEVLDARFERPADFDLQRHLEHSLGIYQSSAPLTDVKIRFTAEVARYVMESQWHHSLSLEEQSDGSLLVQMQLGDLTELKSWLLSFGAQAEVLAPDSLRQSIQQEAASLLKIYGTMQDRMSEC